MLAQLPTTTAGELGTLVTGLAGLVVIVVGLLTIAVLCRQLFWPQKPTEQWAATRGELAMLEKSVTGNETLIKSETSRLEKSVAALDEYTHQRTHDIANAVHALQLRLEVVRIEMRTDAEALIGAVEVKVDRLMVSMARVQAILEGRTRPGRTPLTEPEPQEETP
jgi:hypothetical protein